MPNIENKKFFLESIFFTVGIIGILLVIFFLCLVFRLISKFFRLLQKIVLIGKSLLYNLILQTRINYILNSESYSSKLAYITGFLIVTGFILFYLSIYIRNMNVLFTLLSNELQYINWYELFGYQYMEGNSPDQTKFIKEVQETDLYKPILVSSPEWGNGGVESGSNASENSDSESESESDSDSDSSRNFGGPVPVRGFIGHPDTHYVTIRNPAEEGWPAWDYEVAYQPFFTAIPDCKYPTLPDACDLSYATVKEYRHWLHKTYVHKFEQWIDEHYDGVIPNWDYPRHGYPWCYDCVPMEMTRAQRDAGVNEAMIKERVRWSNWYDYLFMTRWDGRDYYDIGNQTIVARPKHWDRIMNVVLRAGPHQVESVCRFDGLANWEVETFNQGMTIAYPHLAVTRLPSGRTILHDPRIINRPVFIADDIRLSKVQEALRKLDNKNPFTDFPIRRPALA